MNSTDSARREKMKDEMRLRTRQFALRVVRFYLSLPKSTEGQVLGRQLLRCGTSVGAHYREACRSRSDAEFVSKVDSALQELDETMYWIELLQDSGILSTVHHEEHMKWLHGEADELTAIFTATVKTVKARMKQA